MTQQPIHIERVADIELIAQTLRHPKISRHIVDSVELSAIASAPLVYLGAYRGDEFLGLFVLQLHSIVLFEVHTCLLPSAWGPTSLECTFACAEWIWENTSCRRLITSVPVDNPLALRLARKSGMFEYGTNPAAFQRRNELVDLKMLGMSRVDVCL
jgi:RimJ/RimL family protein N-acetyltransferase